MAGSTFNKDIVRNFFHIAPIYPVGVYVKVANCDDSSLLGYCGVVAKINEENLNRPIIILIADNKLKRINPIKVNTSQLDKVILELIL